MPMRWRICTYLWRHPPVILEMLEPHLLLWHTGGSSPIEKMNACTTCHMIRKQRQHACNQSMLWCTELTRMNSRASVF